MIEGSGPNQDSLTGTLGGGSELIENLALGLGRIPV